jgi:hypothetical protein
MFILITGDCMSIPTLIEQAMYAAGVVIVKKPSEDDLLPAKNVLEYTVEFLVAPKEPIFDIAGMQEFMVGLVPEGMVATTISDFEQLGTDLYFGSLNFSEKVGERGREDVFRLTAEEKLSNDPESLDRHGFVKGERGSKENKNVYRNTLVRPFPCKEIAIDVADGLIAGYGIGPRHLRRYGEMVGAIEPDPGPLRRFFGQG